MSTNTHIETIRIDYRSQIVRMKWSPSNPGAPLLVNGIPTPFRTYHALGMRRTAVRLAAAHTWGEVFESLADAESQHVDPEHATCCIWEDVDWAVEPKETTTCTTCLPEDVEIPIEDDDWTEETTDLDDGDE